MKKKIVVLVSILMLLMATVVNAKGKNQRKKRNLKKLCKVFNWKRL